VETESVSERILKLTFEEVMTKNQSGCFLQHCVDYRPGIDIYCTN